MKIKTDIIKNAAKELKEKHQIPGLTVAVIEKGEITESFALGVSDDKDKAMTEDTLFEAASLTKPLFATLFMRLVERGIVDLDTPVVVQGMDNQSVGGKEKDVESFNKLTPRLMLSHQTGLPNWCAAPMEFIFEPGTSFSYCGQGLYILQQLVEKKLGECWPATMKKEFFQPWEMDTDVVWTPEIGSRMSAGFDTEGKVMKIRDEMDGEGLAPEPNSAWSLYANAKLYAQFLCHILNDKGGLKDETFAEMLSPQSHAADGVNWGLGWGLAGEDNHIAWHWGDNGGFKNFAAIDKTDANGIVVFTNCDKGPAFYEELVGQVTDMAEMGQIMAYVAVAE